MNLPSGAICMQFKEDNKKEPEEKEPFQRTRLHLGCGTKYLEGYVNIDIYGGVADRVIDIRKVGKIWKERSVQEIRSHHLFEHFSRVDAVGILAQWTMMLCEKGKLLIEVPDFTGCAQTFLGTGNLAIKTAQIRHLAGDQAYSWGFHREIWFKERFEALLPCFGYDHIRFHTEKWPHSPFLSNLIVSAERENQRTWDELLFAGKEFLKNSLVHPTNEAEVYDRWCEKLEGVINSARKTGLCSFDLPQTARLLDTKSEKSKKPKSS